MRCRRRSRCRSGRWCWRGRRCWCRRRRRSRSWSRSWCRNGCQLCLNGAWGHCNGYGKRDRQRMAKLWPSLAPSACEGRDASRINALPKKRQRYKDANPIGEDLRRVRLEGQSVVRMACLRMLRVVVPRPQVNSSNLFIVLASPLLRWRTESSVGRDPSLTPLFASMVRTDDHPRALSPMDLTCFLHPGWQPLIRPAPAKRDWMDATREILRLSLPAAQHRQCAWLGTAESLTPSRPAGTVRPIPARSRSGRMRKGRSQASRRRCSGRASSPSTSPVSSARRLDGICGSAVRRTSRRTESIR